MPNMELMLTLLAAATALAALARALAVPYPVILVLGGAALAAIPGVPDVTVTPNVVFLVFLPPLLYSSALSTSYAELRHSLRPILVLAIGLVLATVVAVAAVAHVAFGLSWPVSFMLGAILGATDPVSATAIIRRLGAPQRIATLLEGEALVNDGTSLTAFKLAVTAAGAHRFSLGHGVVEFVTVSAGGVLIGAGVGAVSAFLRRRLDDPNLETTIGVVTAYAAYIAADRVGASGVLAAVGAGVVMSRISMDIFSPGTRVRGHAFWEVAGFMLNALLFLLIGLQLRAAISGIGDTSAGTLAWEAAVVVVVVVTIRALWMLAVPAAVRAVGRRGVRATRPDGREQVILSWSGMRGALSIAAAVSVPLDQSGRALVVFLAFTATFVTLVVPGLTLAPLIRRLGLAQSEQRLRASLEARLEVLRAALSRLDRINTEDEAVSPGTIARLRELYETRASALEARLDGDDGDGSASRFEEERRVERELLVAERQALRRLQAERAAPAEALLEIRHDLDLEASRLRGPGSSSR